MISFWQFQKTDIEKEKYKNKLELRYVAFLDILGFKKMVNDDIDKVILALRMIKQYSFEMLGWGHDEDDEDLEDDMKITLFSDSIIISVKDYDLVPMLVWQMAWLQFHLFTKGILIRGGMDVGHIYQDENMVFGDGLVSAYNLESKYAIFPRIIIGKNAECGKKDDFCLDDMGKVMKYKARFQKDDGIPFVEYFTYFFPCYMPDIISLIDPIRETIILGLNEDNTRVRGKYEWLKGYYNYALDMCMHLKIKSESDKKIIQKYKII